jgi:hypothetical protein
MCLGRVVNRKVLGSFCALAASLGSSSSSSASLQVLGEIDISGGDGVCGVAFDGHHNPILVIDGEHEVRRVNRSTGAVVRSYDVPGTDGRQGLAWDRFDGRFFVGQQVSGLGELFALYLPDSSGKPGKAVAMTGPLGLIDDPADVEVSRKGDIWMVSNQDGGELSRLNKLTGQAVLEHGFDLKLGKLTSIALGPDDNVYVAAQRGHGHDARIFKFDPDTGKTTLVMDLGPTVQRVVDIDYDPLSKRWWGVVNEPVNHQDQFEWVKFGGLPLPPSGPVTPPVVPEPSAAALTAAGVGMLAMRRRGRRV